MMNRTNQNCGLVFGIGLLLLVSGCGKTLRTDYLDPQGPSINGIASFVELVRSTGRQVQVWQSLSPRLMEDVDAVVIFHSDFQQISDERIAQIRRMLRESEIQTAVIVARDSDCAIDYWEQVAGKSELSAAEKEAASTSLHRVRRDFKLESSKEFELENGFYGLLHEDRTSQPVVIPVQMELEETPRQIQARWPLNRRLEMGEEGIAIWSTGDETLLFEEFQPTGEQVLVLASATPLLNGGLVDPGNRQLAEDLVAKLPEGKIVVTVSSRWSDGTFAETPGILHFLKVHPHGWIFGQSLVAILLFCWWKLPIFGRPRTTVNSEGVRFGRHIEALGVLLQRTRNAPFARQLLRDWQRIESRRPADRSAATSSNTNSKRE